MRRLGKDRISVLLYADDVIVMSESAEEFQELLDMVNECPVVQWQHARLTIESSRQRFAL